MVHYMPWYESKAVSGHWGWHWTMNHFVPEKGQIASRFTPLIGPYDSGDPDALECQVQLMKLAGIDGIVIDWYGTDGYLDYGANQRHTLKAIDVVRRAGLRFAICYEDQTVPQLIKGKIFSADQAVEHGTEMLRWMQKAWFASPSYFKIAGRPVLLDFGPQYYKNDDLERMLSALSPRPAFYSLQNKIPAAYGAYSWPYPGGGTQKGFDDLNAFYDRAKRWPFIPAAFPRFMDIYQQAGVGKSWGTIDDRDGATYRETLKRALSSGAPIVQLVTWNDWGEGTQIEPSVQFGYRDLELTQKMRGAPYKPADLRLPVLLYRLRKKLGPSRRLDEASRLLLAGKPEAARRLLATAQRTGRSRR